MSEQPFFDKAALDRLHRLGGEKFVGKIIAIFLENVPQRLETALQGEKTGDLKAVEQAIHSLRSSAANVGAVALQDLAAQIEALAEDNIWEGISERLRELEATYSRVEARLKAEMKGQEMPKIAVVEDNPDNLLIVQLILEELYDLRGYESGIEAIEGFKVDKPDLILLDISLPEMDGTEVLQKIRADADLREIPVVALTAHAMAGDRKKYLSIGFNDYVTKPIVDENILFKTIERLLNERGDPL